MVKIYVQTPLKFWFHIKFSREYDYVNEYPYSAKLQNMTCWTKSGTQSSHIKGLDKCVWCWVCSVLSKQRGEVVWWGGVVRFTKANCGQESQWPYTDCGPAVTGMFASWKDPKRRSYRYIFLQTRTHSTTMNQHICFSHVFCPQLIRNVWTRRRIDSSSIIAHPINFDKQLTTAGGIANICCQELDIYIYINTLSIIDIYFLYRKATLKIMQPH